MDEVVEAIEKYQGLVPLVYDIETMCLDEARPQDMPYAVYLKREADKVIAYNKYKRCLAKKEECKIRSILYQNLWVKWRKIESDTSGSYYRDYIKWWHRAMKWSSLAEKFKESK